ncbi:MAG: Integral membrane protein [Parcubacteria bacterium C7867-006]|nr:MAG: Integral membrane protein [Parcubacteria bacterium C7867-006]
MKTENSVLMSQARESLKGKWGIAIGGFVIYVVFTIALQEIPKVGSLLGFLVSGSLALGISMFSLTISRNQEIKLKKIFEGFNEFGNALGARFFITLFTILWSLLLIIPGIIAALSYSMTYFIMADDSSIGPLDAIRKSKQMMSGYKWKLFTLYLRFLGWAILCILTFGIGFLWLTPYMGVTGAKFYDDLRNNSAPAVVS